MGYQSIVYGRILGVNYAWGSNIDINNDRLLFHRLNKNQVIAFGASYKEVELSWMDWIVKFENLLSKLYWTEAVVHLETERGGNYVYQWKNNNPRPSQSDLKNSKDNWEFEGGPLEFK